MVWGVKLTVSMRRRCLCPHTRGYLNKFSNFAQYLIIVSAFSWTEIFSVHTGYMFQTVSQDPQN